MAILYFLCTAFDHWRANKATKKVIKAINEETDVWDVDPNDPEYEIKGNLVRHRLPKTETVVVNRVAAVLREMQIARLHDGVPQ
jgi:hypothetical protein